MKHPRLLVLVACFSLFSSFLSGAVFALEPEEARVSVAWPTETPYQDSTVTVNILFINDSPQQLTILFYGLHFDWMETDQFTGHNISADPVTVDAYGSASLAPVSVHIPENVTVGSHSYFVGVDGEDESADFSWDSNAMTVDVQRSAQDVYNSLLSQVETELSAAEAEYQSPDAISFLEQAAEAISQAQAFADHQQLDEAISRMETASFYLDQAENEEQSYVPPRNDQDLLLLVISAVAFVIVVIVVLLLTKKGTQTPTVKQPTDV